jgi:branched-chain amino acid transport system substrate-binding protein
LCSESPNCANANKVWSAEAARVGLDYGGYVQVAAAAPDYTAACLSLMQRGVDWVDLGLFPQVAVRVVADCAQQGYHPHYMGTGAGVDSQLIPASQAGMTYTGIMQGFPWWLTTPAVQQYQQVMATYSDEKKVNPNPTTSATWEALELFRKAMAHAGDSPTSQDVMTAMDSLKNETLGGLLPQPTTFTAGAISTPMKCGWVITLENGTFKGGDKPECLS